MRLADLVTCYIYDCSKTLSLGEYTTIWKYKGKEKLNKQQDIDELTKNSAGDIDYEIVKLRTDRNTIIEKGNGISFTKLELDDDKNVVDTIPTYKVDNVSQIGRTRLINLKINEGNQ